MSADLKHVIALVGPPNAGKTTLFNALTGTGSRPINYPGATVEYALGTTKRTWGQEIRIADTPGIYSLSPKSPEEEVTLQILQGKTSDRTTAVIVVADGTQLSRHLPLVRQVIETGCPVLVAVTMTDLLEREGRRLDTQLLSRKLGAEVLATHARENRGLADLVSKVAKLSRQDGTARPMPAWSAARQALELKNAAQIAEEVVVPLDGPAIKTQSAADTTRRLDRWLLHPVWGLAIFTAIMALLFTSIFWVAAPAMDAITGTCEWLAAKILAAAPGRLWADFLAGGIVLSAGSILTFVPQIMILFLGITLLEDSGYLARAATLIDRPLSRLGLNGRSFVPLLSGYACAIPAMLAARTIPNRKERWLTLFIIPLMSCSARLPVYSLLLAFIFWGQPAWKPGVALTVIYLFSLVVGAAAATLVNRLIRANDPSFFMMELPLYRPPSIRAVLNNVLLKTQSYLVKAGPAIFVFATVLWAATTFPHYNAPTPSEKFNHSYAAQAGHFITPVMEPMGGDWRTGVALISAFAAREVFVASLGLVLQVTESAEGQQEASLLSAMQKAERADGSPLFTPASCVGLILFFLIALQCMSTLVVARREFGGWKFPILQLVSFNLVAYVLAVSTVQTLHFFGVP